MMDTVSWIILASATVAISWVISVVFFRKGSAADSKADQNGSDGQAKGKKQAQSEGKKNSAKQSKSKGTTQQATKEKFSHDWLISSLKGHTGNVLGLDLSPNNKFLATCAEDRTVYLWFTKDFADRDHKSIRVNIPFDHATFIRWSPDSKAFIITRQEEGLMEVYKLGRKADNSIGNITSALKWPQTSSNISEYVGLGIACNGKFIMSCSKEGCIVLRELKGVVLKSVLVGLKETTIAKVSPCGRYIVAAGGNQMEVYEVHLSNTSGQVQDVISKWKVKTEDSAKISYVDFNTDSSKIAVMCYGGQWFLYNTLGSRVNVETRGTIGDKIDGKTKTVIAISGDSRVVIVGAESNIYLFSAFSGNLLDKIDDAHKGHVSCVTFTADSKYFLTAGDNVIHVFNNVSWYKETIKSLKNQLQDSSITGSMRSRLVSESASFEQEVKKKGFAIS